jgi:hypothetical protein
VIPGHRLLCLASDDEARRGAALAKLTQKHSLPSSSNIFYLLNNLRLFNTLVGNDDITSDKDYKHVFKRLRNLLLREKGTVVNGVHITPSLLSLHLRSDGMPIHRANYLLNPEDKQDVTLVFMLLKAVWSLRHPTPTDRPGFSAARRALNILGSLFRHLLLPYTHSKLSLHEQLVHLSAASHLVMFLYTEVSGRTRFLPKILYNDIQIMIKNVFSVLQRRRLIIQMRSSGLFCWVLTA